MLSAGQWFAVIVVLGLFVVLGGCHRTQSVQDLALSELSRELARPVPEYRLAQRGRALALSERSIASLEQELASARQEQQRVREGWVLYTLGLVYQEQDRLEQALTRYEQALTIAQEVKAQSLEAATLANLGYAYSRVGQNERARTVLEQALALAREGQDWVREARVLTRLGWVYHTLEQPEQALPLLEQALALRKGDDAELNTLGNIYHGLGQHERALTFLEQALAIARETKNRFREAFILMNLGNVHKDLGQSERALALYEQALTLAQEGKWRYLEAFILMNLGNVYKEQGQLTQAHTLYEQALALFQKEQWRLLEAAVLVNLGSVYQEQGQPEQALTFLEQGLALAQEIKHRKLEAGALLGFMEAWRARAQPQLAVFHGKLSVNIIQTLRADLRRLDPELQQSFLRRWEGGYRRLAELLISEGRLPEAQQVLDLLKEREFFDFVRRDATVGDLRGQAALTPTEAAWATRYRTIADRLAALATEYGVLRYKQAHTADDTQRLGALEADLRVARQAFEQFLIHLQAEVHQTPQGQERITRLIEESQGLMDALRDLGPGTVALYTLVTDTAYSVILTTPEVQLARETPIAAADLARTVQAFREALDPAWPGGLRRDPRLLARELYQLLVAPIAQDLQQAQAQTLMWSLDGVLRYLPLAALHDGEQYLLERYRLAVFTPASATRLKDSPQRPWRGAGFGVSKAHAGFSPLPTVPDELRGIIRDPAQRNPAGVLPGTIHLDEAFTDASLRAALHQRYPVVHIASHFQLHPGDDTASFLLLGDGSHLPLAQLKTWPQPFQGVELLTLSACNTAVGSPGAEGKEVEGLAVLAQRQGAKAVLATLWAVVDESTKVLMETFYRLREHQPGLSKVEALRQAQLALLRGAGPPGAATAKGARGIDLVEGTRSGPGGALPPFVPEAQAPYAHPAYWAPFVLIGNWR